MPNVPPSTEDQIGEHIPWEHLTIPPQPDRKLLMYGLAAGLIVAVLGVVIVRQLNRPSPAELQPVIPVTAPQEAAPAQPTTAGVEDIVPQPAVTLALAEPEAPTELSEADLMAVDTGGLHREIAGTAEWLVLEFFTLDPSDPWRDRVEAASGLRLPSSLIPETADGSAVSYVEWTRTRSVDQTGEDTYRASVLIRRLVASDGVTYRRLPTEWVNVDLRVESDGNVRAVSLPQIITPAAGNLIPLQESDLTWATDAAGINWPATTGR